MNTPNDRLYSKEHEWAKVDSNKAVVGITFHAQDALGDIVYVELPKVGASFSQGQEFGVVESVKTVSTLFSPYSGKVLEVNEALSSSPETINKDPYELGWIMKLELSNPSEKEALLDSAKYDEFVSKK